MASITFEGPSIIGGRSSTVVEMDDQAFMAVVQAVCASEDYAGDNPGLFVIQKTIQNWTHITTHYQMKLAQASAEKQVEVALEPLKSSITVNVDGTPYNINELTPIAQ